MPKAEELCEITAGGTSYRFWESVEVERRFGQIISHVRLRVAELGDTAKGWKSLRLKPGDPATATLAGRKVADGIVSVRQVAYTGTTHQIEIISSSKTMDLVVSTPDAAKGGQFKNSSISQIVNSITQPYGIKFKLVGNTAGADKLFERVSIHPGETAWQFIERLCRMRDLHLRDDENGDLIGGRATLGGGSGAELVEGKNIESAHGVMSNADQVSPVTAMTTNFGTDTHWGDDARDVTATVSNSDVQRYRPMTFVAEQPGDKADMVMRANHEVAVSLGTTVEIFITCPGWLMNDGSLWIDHIGESMAIYSPMLFPTDQETLSLRGVVHRQSSESGTTTVLEFCLPNALSAQGAIQTGDFPAQSGAGAQPGGSDD